MRCERAFQMSDLGHYAIAQLLVGRGHLDIDLADRRDHHRFLVIGLGPLEAADRFVGFERAVQGVQLDLVDAACVQQVGVNRLRAAVVLVDLIVDLGQRHDAVLLDPAVDARHLQLEPHVLVAV